MTSYLQTHTCTFLAAQTSRTTASATALQFPTTQPALPSLSSCIYLPSSPCWFCLYNPFVPSGFLLLPLSTPHHLRDTAVISMCRPRPSWGSSRKVMLERVSASRDLEIQARRHGISLVKLVSSNKKRHEQSKEMPVQEPQMTPGSWKDFNMAATIIIISNRLCS